MSVPWTTALNIQLQISINVYLLQKITQLIQIESEKKIKLIIALTLISKQAKEFFNVHKIIAF